MTGFGRSWALRVGLCAALGGFAPCWALSGIQTAFVADDWQGLSVRATQRVPARVNVNQASLSELKTLPGIDDNLALKLIRARQQAPLRMLDDLTRLPWLEAPLRFRLSTMLKHRVTF